MIFETIFKKNTKMTTKNNGSNLNQQNKKVHQSFDYGKWPFEQWESAKSCVES